LKDIWTAQEIPSLLVINVGIGDDSVGGNRERYENNKQNEKKLLHEVTLA